MYKEFKKYTIAVSILSKPGFVLKGEFHPEDCAYDTEEWAGLSDEEREKIVNEAAQEWVIDQISISIR